MKKFFLRIAVFAALCLVISSSAFADVISLDLNSEHVTEVPLINGVPSYTSAAFSRMDFRLRRRGVATTDEIAALTGTLTITGGEFKYGESYLTHDYHGEDAASGQSFTLVSTGNSNRVRFHAKDDDGANIYFAGTSDNEGMSGYNLSWTIGDGSIIEAGSATLPTFKSTVEQLKNFVPYIEFTVGSDGTVSGATWRIVNPDDPSTALTSASGFSGMDIELETEDGEEQTVGDEELSKGGTVFSGTLSSLSSFNINNLDYIDIRLTVNDALYCWTFRPVTPQLGVMFKSKAKASLTTDYKTDFSNAAFKDVGFVVYDNTEYNFERDFATDLETAAQGSITISGASGSYTYGSSRKTARSSETFVLYNEQEGTKDYRVAADSSGTQVNFYGGAETGALKGATLAINFDAMPEMNGTVTVPSTFRTMTEQLAYAIPYFELVTSNGNVTSIRWRVVKSDDTDTALTLADVSDFRMIRIDPYDSNGKRLTSTGKGLIRFRRGREIEDSASTVLEGTAVLSDYNLTLALTDVKSFRVLIDTTDGCRYVWSISPSSTESDSAGSTTPETSGVDKDTAADTAGVNADDIQDLKDNDNVTIGGERDTDEVSDADLKLATGSNFVPTLILPVITVNTKGVYIFTIVFTDTSLLGKLIRFFALPQSSSTEESNALNLVASSASNISTSAIDTNTDGSYMFLDSDGKETDKIPSDGKVSVLVNLKGGTYGPIVSVASSESEDDDDDNGDTSSKGSSSGCNSGFVGLAAFAALSALLFRSRRK